MGSSHAAGSALENQIQTIRNLVFTNKMSISSIKSLLDIETLKVSNLESKVSSNQSVLEETNNILMDIGNALALDFANRLAEVKEDISNIKEQKSQGKFDRAESRIESKDKGKKAGNIFTQTASKAASPVQGIFSKIMSFVGLTGLGIALNAGFKWLKDGGVEKLSKFGDFLMKHWKWVAGFAGIILGGGLLIGLAGVFGTLAGVFAILVNPVTLTFLGLAASLAGLGFLMKKRGDEPLGQDLSDKMFGPDGSEERIKSQEGSDAINRLFGHNTKEFHRGGFVSHGGTVHQGEFVINADATRKIGLNRLNKLNRGISRSPTITTINMPPITRRSGLKGQPDVATEVVNISSTNLADTYRQLTPMMYGVFM